jgi:hypothetical protein
MDTLFASGETLKHNCCVEEVMDDLSGCAIAGS